MKILERVIIIWLVCLNLAASVQAAVELRAGVAAVSITPPTGTPLGGLYRKRLGVGVIDELYAKAIVFEQRQYDEGIRPRNRKFDYPHTRIPGRAPYRSRIERCHKVIGR